MKITYELDTAEEMLKKRGLDQHGRVQRLLTSEVYRLSDPYVPMQQGILAHGPANVVADDYLIYNTPYAHYHWKGELMVGRAPKHYTGKPMKYHGAPKRGKEWTRRMWADKKSEILDTTAKEAGGTAEK